jgi:endonuclease/exonuclease/phosphatase family metal-dependent hydrolase
VGGDPLRVLTYNVRYANLDTGWVEWPERRDAVASTIRHHRPDAVAVQECWMEQLPDLRTRLPEYEWVAHPDDNGEHTPIAYRPERLTVERSGAYGLAPEGERGVPAWDAAAPRQATHATFTDRETGVPFTLTSVHLDHRGERAREEGARLVHERVPDGHVVVAGDCNCGPTDPPYAVLAGDLTDAREAAPYTHGPAETYVGFDGDGTGEEGDPERRRLDYVFVRGFEVAGYAVAADVNGAWRHPSDHLPVVADLRPAE